MSVKIPTNPEHLKNFMINYIGKILPASEAKKIRKKLEKNCIDISKEMFDKIMAQYKKVVKKEKVKLDGGSKKRTKKRRKSNKRRTKKNQKGGLIGEFIIYSFGFVSLLSIALIVVAAPFILIKDCLDKRAVDAQNQYSLEQRQRRWREEEQQWREDELRTMNQSRPRPRRGRLNQVRQLRAFQNDGGSGFGDRSTAEAADLLLGEGITDMSASRARDEY